MTSTFTVTVTLTPCAPGAWSATYTVLDGSNNVGTFKYRYLNCDTQIEFQLDSPYTGWLSIAWHDTSSTTGHQRPSTDLIIGYATGASAVIEDQYMWPSGGRDHSIDTATLNNGCGSSGGANSIISSSGSETTGPAHTTLNFVLALGSSDGSSCDNVLQKGSSYYFFMASCDTADDYNAVKHDNRGRYAGTITLP